MKNQGINPSLEELVRTSITQTGGIEDIIKATVAKATQELRLENTVLKQKLDQAKEKIEWLDQLAANNESDKAQALEDQRNRLREIGGHEFRRTLDAHDMKEAKDRREIAFLEAHHMHSRSKAAGQGGYLQRSHQSMPFLPPAPANDKTQAWLNSLPAKPTPPHAVQEMSSLPHPSTVRQVVLPRTRSSTALAAPNRVSEDATPRQSPERRRKRSYTLEPIAQSPPPRDSVSPEPLKPLRALPPPISKAPQKLERYESPFFCQKCGQKFVVEAIGVFETHLLKCQGTKKPAGMETGDLREIGRARSSTDTSNFGPGRTFGLHSMPDLHAQLTKVGLQGTAGNGSRLKLPSYQFPQRESPTKND